MSIFRNIILSVATHQSFENFVRKTPFCRPLVKRFIAGDTLKEAFFATHKLVNKGYKVSLDFLGENTLNREEALTAKCDYIEILNKIHEENLVHKVGISIKLTQCGLDIDKDFAYENYKEILKVAKGYDIFVRVDMESSQYTDQTVELTRKAFKNYKRTGTVLQSYLHRTMQDAQELSKKGITLRIVKGAYLEPPQVAFQKKEEVDDNLLALAKYLLKNGHYPAIATHDLNIIEEIIAFTKEENIDKQSFEFQMLYGISRETQKNLLDNGYIVRIYIPYGDRWYPYFVRRLAERPANLLFILKNLFKK